MSYKGIDVSRWQSEIDWQKVARSGVVDFAIIKAGGSDDGFYTDSYFERNYAGAKAAGIPVGAYYIVGPRCQTRVDGRFDAQRFIQIIAGKKFEYPVVLDFELPPTWSRAGNTDAAIGFCDEMESAGFYVSIYASDISGFMDRLELSRLGQFDKWVASYGREPQHVKVYGMWQTSDSGSVPGIRKAVDTDIAYHNFPEIMKRKHLNGY